MERAAIRVWGAGGPEALLRRWEAGLKGRYPYLRIETRLTGSDVGVAGLYTGCADIAVLGRECTAFEDKAFEWIFRYPPAQVQIATGSLSQAGRSPALLAFVHRDNPLTQLNLEQLDAIFGYERLSGARTSIGTWGELGLRGEWSEQPVNLYSDDTESGTGRFFRREVLKGSAKLHWERLREFKGPDAGRAILTALSVDRTGLAVTGGAGERLPQVKALALARKAGEEAVTASRDSLISRGYPLTRTVRAYFNRRPAAPLDPPLSGFLRYLLSEEGQRAVVADAHYLPLNAQIREEELKKLD